MAWKQDLRDPRGTGHIRDDGARVFNVGTQTSPLWHAMKNGWVVSGDSGKIRQFASAAEAMKAVDRE